MLMSLPAGVTISLHIFSQHDEVWLDLAPVAFTGMCGRRSTLRRRHHFLSRQCEKKILDEETITYQKETITYLAGLLKKNSGGQPAARMCIAL